MSFLKSRCLALLFSVLACSVSAVDLEVSALPSELAWANANSIQIELRLTLNITGLIPGKQYRVRRYSVQQGTGTSYLSVSAVDMPGGNWSPNASGSYTNQLFIYSTSWRVYDTNGNPAPPHAVSLNIPTTWQLINVSDGNVIVGTWNYTLKAERQITSSGVVVGSTVVVNLSQDWSVGAPSPTPTPSPSVTPAPLTLDLNGTATKAVYQLYIDGQLYKEQEVSSGSTTIDIPHTAEFQGKKYLLNLKTIGYGEENSVTNKTIAEGIIEAGDTYDDVAVDAQKSNPLPVSSIDSAGNVTKSNVSVSQIEWKPGDIETTYTYTVGGNTTTVAYQGTGSESVTVYELRAASVQNMAGQEAITQAVKENTATASQGDQALVDAINANTQSTSEGLEALAGAISSPSPSPTPDPGSSPSPTPTPEPSSVEQEIEEFDTSAFSVGDGPGNIASLSNQVQWTVRMPGSNQLVDLNPMNQSWFAPLAYWIRQIIWWILTIVTIRHIYLKVRELIDEFVQAALGADITRFVRNNTSILATLAAKIPGAGPFLQVIVFFIGNGPIIAAIVLFTGFIVLHFAPAALGSSPLVGWLIGGQGFVANLAQVIVPNSPELHTSVFLLNQFIPLDHVLSCLFVFLISEVAGVFFVASAWLWWRSKI